MAVKTVVLSMLQVKAVGGNPTFAFKAVFDRRERLLFVVVGPSASLARFVCRDTVP